MTQVTAVEEVAQVVQLAMMLEQVAQVSVRGLAMREVLVQAHFLGEVVVRVKPEAQPVQVKTLLLTVQVVQPTGHLTQVLLTRTYFEMQSLHLISSSSTEQFLQLLILPQRVDPTNCDPSLGTIFLSCSKGKQ